MARPTYNREWEIVLAYDESGEPVCSVVYRLQVERGRLVRYDDFRGFHRHAPGFPPGRHEWIAVPPGAEFAFIRADLAQNAEKYEREARASGFEVAEDEPETDS